MTNEEKRLLSEFLNQLSNIRGVTRHPEADSLIRKAASAQPDALYLLVQKALLQDQALSAAKAQISRLQQQLDRANSQPIGASQAGFLNSDPWASPRAQHSSAPASVAPREVSAAMPAGAASPWGGFLGAAATTAAGVAGGAFLFHGIESLMDHHDHGRGYSEAAFDEGEHAPENVTINQYYGNEPAGHPDGSIASSGENTPIADEDDWEDSYDDDANSVDV